MTMSDFDHFVGTRPVSGKHAFDTAALTAWLEKNLRRLRAARSTVEMFKGGQSNPTYKLVTPAQQLRDARQARARWPSCCLRPTRSSASSR